MAKSPFKVAVPCPQCGEPKMVGYYGRKAAAKALCRPCYDKVHGKHGEAETRLYHIWEGMRQRCGVIGGGEQHHHKYADKGITVCEEWAKAYIPFMLWAKANGYQDHLTIDRIDGSQGYEPGNCRWATYVEQNRNRRMPGRKLA